MNTKNWVFVFLAILLTLTGNVQAAFDGTGTFDRLYNWEQDKANGINVRADRMDAEMDGMATGLSTCITKDGQTTLTSDIPLSTFKFTNVGNATASTNYASAGQVRDNLLCTGTATGSANAYTLNRTIAGALTSGAVVWLKVPATNTASSTVNVDSGGAVRIKKNGSSDVVAGDLVSGTVYPLYYDGTFFQAVTAQTPSFTVVTATTGVFDTISASSSYGILPVGGMMPYAGASSTVPSGWLVEYGQSVSRTGVYATLFAVIGTTYGTADSNSFNIPDMRGRVAAGLDNMGGTAASRVSYTTAGISGTVLGSAGGDQRMQAHDHTITDPGHTHTILTGGSAGSGLRGDATGTNFSGTSQAAFTGITINVSGTGNSQNMQPTMMLNWIIRYQ